jgi:iron complex transport system substrate-binding protein
MRLQRVTVPIALLLIVSVLSVGGGGATAVAASGSDCSYPATFTDATGTEVTVEEEPESVVTLNPSAAQTMWEIGARDKVTGVTKLATFLEGAEEKANVSGGGFTTVVTEKVVGLQPDLVLVPNATNNQNPQQIAQLREAGLTVFVFEQAGSLDDISAKTRLTGRLVGACDGAEERVTRMEEELATVEEAVEGEERPDVLFVLGPSGFTAGSNTFIDTAIQAAGANNIATEEDIQGYKPISEEIVEDRDPDYIVKPTGVALPDSPVYNQSTAVQEGRVLEVNNDHISQPAPRIVGPIRLMAQTFHPEAYEAANATPTPTDSPTATGMDDDTDAATGMDDDGTTTATETTTPGFGPVVALVALAAALALARRR